MWEALKIVWDVVVIRDGIRKGKMNWRKTLFTAGFVVLEYVIVMPALLVYVKHPEYKPLFIAAMVLAMVNLAGFVWLALRWRSRQPAE